MKRFLKVLGSLMAVIMLATTCFGLVGCSGDIVKVELTVAVYDYENEEWLEDNTLTIDFYRHLAPETVDNMLEYIRDGYYDDAIFYSNTEGNKIFMGDLKMDDDGDIYQNQIMPAVEGEFTAGGTIGSNLKVQKGSVALWRTWYDYDGSYNTSSTAVDTGRATWFMPTSSITGYDGYFCVFAVIDMENTANSNVWEAIKSAVMTDNNVDRYQVYYTGTYDETKPSENNGLEFHCETDVVLDNGQTEFVADGFEYVCYNKTEIKVAKGVGDSPCGAKIVSAKVI